MNSFILFFLVLLIAKITYDDYKTQKISDLYSILIILIGGVYNTFYNKDTLFYGLELFSYTIGFLLLFKLIVENILFYLNRETEILGEGDIVLFGALAMFLDKFGNFLVMFYVSLMLFFSFLLIKIISKKNIKDEYAFVPSISVGFFITLIFFVK